ncbi:hypothetical protein BX661DRAFT_41910 [Kickxella alabastrina]|uniref:uncharacterized protein n=1 Tax=Kickxella alabastrina TaxID=61397 RepID=UPI00221FCC6A|nr:uncharacterized protein BX661DRAFT_41910 [Kickxella alabastrina]KAI7824972.1 hypothetical protein BX661DRAFT_41910 [Kickxella alabastrina]
MCVLVMLRKLPAAPVTIGMTSIVLGSVARCFVAFLACVLKNSNNRDLFVPKRESYMVTDMHQQAYKQNILENREQKRSAIQN